MDLIKDEKKYMMQIYKRYNLTLVKAKDKYVWDNKGKKYLDFFSGISVSNIGHCNTKVVAAAKKQLDKLMHVSNYYYTEPVIKLSQQLVKSTFPGKVFLSNSGTEANECAFKLARKWGCLNNGNRYEIICFKDSFHGRTFASLAATGQEKFHKNIGPIPPGFKFANFNDINSVEKLINENTAAVMIEPIQGEGGINIVTKKFIKDLKNLCKKYNLLLIFDEIQTGLGRTGKLFAYQNFQITPDVITLAKSLACGLPLGAVVAGKKVMDVFSYGDHGSTFGGNPVSCAAAGEVLKGLTPSLMLRVKNTGDYFISKLNELKSKYTFIKDVRGIGLMIGVELDFPGKDIVKFCQDRGVLINCIQENILRFLPPLIITKEDINKVIKILEDSFKCQM